MPRVPFPADVPRYPVNQLDTRDDKVTNLPPKLEEDSTTESILLFTPDTHAKSVDVFVQSVKQANSLYDHVIHPVHIELDFGPTVTVGKSELGLLDVTLLQQGGLTIFEQPKRFFSHINSERHKEK